jgi:2-desacetyl-2-hydroxyethyl bacteriochlorophyllide A dehydrogenase
VNAAFDATKPSIAGRPGAVTGAAAVFLGERRVCLQEVVVPAPGPRELRVKLEGCGICASNLPVWEGRPWFKYPLEAGAPGHEGWGVVDAVGDEVADLRPGDRVAIVSSHAYAGYDVAPADHVVRIPESLRGHPVPAEPLGCAMNIFRRSDVHEGHRVAIVGIGFLGALLTELCVRAGATVTAISRRKFSRDVAESLGARASIELESPAQAAKSARALCSDGFERVIEAVGTQEALDLATELTGVRARLVIAGFHQDGPRSVNLQKWNWQGLDVVNAHERDPQEYRRGMQEAIDLIAAGELDPRPLYTHRFELAELGLGLAAVAGRPAGFLKGLVHCG